MVDSKLLHKDFLIGMGNSMELKLLIIIPTDIHLGVIESQMYGLAILYSKYYEVTVATPISVKASIKQGNVKEEKYYGTKGLKTLVKRSDIVYFRDIINFFKLFLVCKLESKSILYDFRGLAAEESFSRNKNIFKYGILFVAEFLAAILSDRIQCVSENMKRELRRRYYIKKEINVIPCLTHRCIKRNDERYEKVRFVYVGGLSKWQKIDLIISVCERIQVEIDCMFTFITNKPQELKDRLKESQVFNWKVLTGNNDFVQEILKNQDFGFLLRDNYLFNKLSSPIKFLEYVSNGVIPIITPFVGDYSNIVAGKDLGILYINDSQKLIDEIKHIVNEIESYRNKLFEFSYQRTWENFHINNYEIDSSLKLK
ncbi:MAG: hypothetical protein A2Y40_01165 [Candidatus Margulisbacteria bacterium GWF2_35_9]|nr:MAG: hypothetical protein A2Y40_01165 [Candidatus Margulisbacteria bacterium GWF2_35_9]